MGLGRFWLEHFCDLTVQILHSTASHDWVALSLSETGCLGFSLHSEETLEPQVCVVVREIVIGKEHEHFSYLKKRSFYMILIVLKKSIFWFLFEGTRFLFLYGT